MRNNIINDWLIKNSSPESRTKIQKKLDELIKFNEKLIHEGYVYNTDKSYSLELIRKEGFNPIGITTMNCEETFIFNTYEEAEEAYKHCELNLNIVDGWWYGKSNFIIAQEEYEKQIGREIKIYWL